MKGNQEQGPITLHFGQALVRRSTANTLLLAIFGLVALLFVILFGWAAAQDSQQSNFLQVLTEAWNATLADPGVQWMSWALAILAPLLVLVLWILGRARLTVDQAGIRASIPRIPALPFLRQSDGDWSLSWNEIRRAELALPASGGKHPQRLGFARLNLETDKGPYSLFVWRWYNPRGDDHRLSFRELRKLRTLDFHQVLQRSPLARALEANGLTLEDRKGAPAPGHEDSGTALGEEQFDLNSHRGLQIQLGLLALAGGYALFDTYFLSPWKPVESMPFGPFLLAGVVGLAITAPLGRGAPRVERVGVAALTIAALVAAAYPGLMRFNAATGQVRTVQYEAIEPGVFHTPNANFPELDLRTGGLEEYWARYTPGKQHDFHILHGAAGFYQLNMDALHRRTRAFYRERRESN